MKSEKYFVVDVTTLLKWNRSPVGIIRTQLEFTNYLLENFQDVVYFEFNEEKDNLLPVTKERIEKKVKQLLDFKNLQVEHNSKLKISKKANNKYFILLKKIIHIYKYEGSRQLLIKICNKICPLKIKNIVKKIYIEFFNKQSTIKNSKNDALYFNSIISLTEISIAEKLNVPFLTKNAIVISIGLDWDYSNYPLLFWLKRKIGFEFVGSFYDGIPVINPKLVQSYYFSQKFFSHVYYLINLSNRIFCISDFSKKQMIDICNNHNIDNIPILKTIHLGDSVFKKPTELNFAPRKHKKDYILYVSTIESRKNHILLLKVWQKLQQEEFTNLPDLVFVGMMGWGIDELLALYKNDEKLQKNVHFYENVDDMELVTIYKNAKFTVFPSFAEGWGLGAVESMLYGKPCLISTCDALLEATQGLMPSASPTDINTWCELIKEFSTNEEKLDYYKNIIKEKFKSRTWEEFSIDFTKFAKGEI
ncbi:glycosyltransferase family 4 protein [Aliarcobacter cryaerophilus]|uniref:glycosyltransferase family 4 protein n=1 Tax=Aliarcobacter cryaerophilus TaxID=28198 RepID=UPI003DA39993